jgi:integrase
VSALLLLIYTGSRISEILTLRWGYVTSHHLELQGSKTGSRRIPLPREAYDILMELPRQPGNPCIKLSASDSGPRNDL